MFCLFRLLESAIVEVRDAGRGNGCQSFLLVSVSAVLFPPWGTTVDAEFNVSRYPSEKPELTNVLPFKPGVGQNIATRASPTAKSSFVS